jgi:cytochrome c2
MKRLKQVTRIAAIYTFVGLTVSAMALPSAWKAFSSLYDIKDGSNLAKAKCTVCHTNMKGKTLNAYGKQIDVLLKKDSTKKVTDKYLKAVEDKDATGNGGTNISRIHADKLPGG